MRIEVIGAGNIGGNLARQPAAAGHEVIVSFARDEAFGRVDGGFGVLDLGGRSAAETHAAFDPVRTRTLDRTEVGHQEPKGDLYGEEFHRDDAVALVATLRGTPPSGTGRP